MKLAKTFTVFFCVVALVFSAGLVAAQGTNTGEAGVPSGEPFEAVPAVDGAISALVIGTGAPPATLAGFAMTPVPTPGAPACTGILPPLPTPLGAMGVAPTDGVQRCIGAGWATWSHGYVGDAYFTGSAVPQTLTMPPNTGAVYFYVEPNVFQVFNCQAVAQPGGVSTGPFAVDGSGGAVGVGFWDAAGGTIQSIEVNCDPTASGFATGEFAVSAAGGGDVIGAVLTGQAGTIGICKNNTTGQTAFQILAGGDTLDCEAAGLTASPGDKILLITIGTAN